MLVAPSPKLTTVTWSVPRRTGGEGEPHGDGQAAAHHAGGDHQPRLRVGQVHGPTLALGGAGDLAAHLGDQLVEGDALGDAVVDAAVGGDHGVVGPQVGGHGGGDRLLAAHPVVGHPELAGAEPAHDAVLGGPDRAHGAVDAERRLVVERGDLRRRPRATLLPWRSPVSSAVRLAAHRPNLVRGDRVPEAPCGRLSRSRCTVAHRPRAAARAVLNAAMRPRQKSRSSSMVRSASITRHPHPAAHLGVGHADGGDVAHRGMVGARPPRPPWARTSRRPG